MPRAEIAIVGGGPAGAALATRLARRGADVVLFERLGAPRWRAGGVFSSPRTREQLRDLGLPEAALGALVSDVPVMRVRTLTGARCDLAYPDAPACGLDRVRVDAALLDRARDAGAQVRAGWVVRSIAPDAPDHPALEVSGPEGGRERWEADVLVGADGPASLVARSVGVARPVRRLRRAGITAHRVRADDTADAPADMVIGAGWYLGICPVPASRVNLGLVLGAERLRHAPSTVDAAPRALLQRSTDRVRPLLPEAGWLDGTWTDEAQVALPLAHRVSRAAVGRVLLVGDATGFVDPLSGDGIHRALRSAELAADAILERRRGRSGPLDRYDARLRRRYLPKDLVSWLLQAFLAHPAAMDYAVRRLDRRSRLRATFRDVLADLAPPERALRPGFLAALLAP